VSRSASVPQVIRYSSNSRVAWRDRRRLNGNALGDRRVDPPSVATILFLSGRRPGLLWSDRTKCDAVPTLRCDSDHSFLESAPSPNGVGYAYIPSSWSNTASARPM
jgi:hypothetical protein